MLNNQQLGGLVGEAGSEILEFQTYSYHQVLWVASNSVLLLIRRSPARVPTPPPKRQIMRALDHQLPPISTLDQMLKPNTRTRRFRVGHDQERTVSCQRHIWANGCYKVRPCWPQISLVTWPTLEPSDQTTVISQPGPKVLSVSLSGSKSLPVARSSCLHLSFPVFSFTRCVILLNLRGWKWAKIRLVAVYPIHRPRRLRAARPTWAFFPNWWGQKNRQLEAKCGGNCEAPWSFRPFPGANDGEGRSCEGSWGAKELRLEARRWQACPAPSAPRCRTPSCAIRHLPSDIL